jgi:type VI secretion system secreted protein VgrG
MRWYQHNFERHGWILDCSIITQRAALHARTCLGEPYELYKGEAKIGQRVADEFGRMVVKDHQPGTSAYRVKLGNGGQFDLKVNDALSCDPSHEERRSNRGECLV